MRQRGASQGPVDGPFGAFAYTVATGSWWWSDGLYEIHGFEPGEVVPSTELVVAHKHPDDVDRARKVLEAALGSGTPFSLWHHVVDARRRVRQVVSVGAGVHDEAGQLVEVRGFMVDVTTPHRQETAAQMDEAVRRSAASRGTIEQAKGVMLAVCGLDAEEAFQVLVRQSQDRNVKVRDLAAELLSAVDAARGTGQDMHEVVRQVLVPLSSPETH